MKLMVVVFIVSSLAIASHAAIVAADYDGPLNDEALPLFYRQLIKKSEPRDYNEEIRPSDFFNDAYKRMFQPKHSKAIRTDSKHPLCFFTGLPCAMY